MKTIINECQKCPFLNSDYDDFVVGKSTTDECGLAKFLNHSEYFISFHTNVYGPDPNSITPEWCPLKKEEHSFQFQSNESIDEIEEFKKKIEELKDKVFELTSNSNQLNELYNNLNNLYKNEGNKD